MTARIFLGGTCGGYDWRADLIPKLEELGIECYNPYIKGRKRIDTDQKKEIEERQSCDVVLYCITPDIRGVYSIAEVIDDSNKRPRKTMFFFFDESEKKYPLKGMTNSLKEVGQMVRRNGGRWFETYDDMLTFFRECKFINGELYTEKEIFAYTE